MDLPESSLNSSHLLFPPAFLLSSEEELETLESSEDDSSELDSFAAQNRDMIYLLVWNLELCLNGISELNVVLVALINAIRNQLRRSSLLLLAGPASSTTLDIFWSAWPSNISRVHARFLHNPTNLSSRKMKMMKSAQNDNCSNPP